MEIAKADEIRIKEVMDDTVARFIDELPQKIEHIMTGAVLSLLGLQSRYGDKYEIDHCNGNRSILSDLITKRCRESIEVAVEPVINAALVDLVKNTQFLEAIVKDVTSKFQRALDNRLNEDACKWASAQCEKVIHGLDKMNLTAMYPAKHEPENPHLYNTKVGEMLLAEIAERLAGNLHAKDKKAKAS